MCFREYLDILTEPKNNEKLLIFIDRASRYLQTVKDRLNNDGNQTLKRFSTNSDVKRVNAISNYLKPNMPLPQYLPLSPLSAGYRLEPHSEVALHPAA